MVSQMSVNELIKGVQQLGRDDFDLFLSKIKELREMKTADGGSVKEKRLLQRIKAGMPDPVEFRYAMLIAKRDMASLSDTEYEELVKLTEKFEDYQTQRLKWMIELASLKGMELTELVAKYDLKPKPIL